MASPYPGFSAAQVARTRRAAADGRSTPVAIGAFGAILVLAGSCLARGGIIFQPLGDLPGGAFFSKAAAVSADGTVVVGLATSANGDQPFVWTAGAGMNALALLPGTTTGRASGVSGDGAVVVGRCGDRSVRWVSGSPIDLVTFGNGSFSSANGVSRDGVTVVGNAYNGSIALPDTWPYLWTPTLGSFHLDVGTVTAGSFEAWGAMCASADGSVVAGNEGLFIFETFRWTSAGFVGLGFLPFGPQQPSSSAAACSADGSVLVGRSISVPGMQAFRWTSAGMVGIGDLDGGAFSSEALAVSADGTVVVGRGTSDAGMEAFLWDAAGGMRSLAAVLEVQGAQHLSGWTLRAATGISADGRTIVGWGTNPDGHTESWLARLPDPATCYANCDNSTVQPVINALDFSCFLNRFSAGDTYANCDGSTVPPALNIIDFGCFLNRYASGCQ